LLRGTTLAALVMLQACCEFSGPRWHGQSDHFAPGAPHELFAPVHLDAHDAVVAARMLRAQVTVPIHFGTFAQGDEGEGEGFTSSPAAAGS
jgi:hypothetical protein